MSRPHPIPSDARADLVRMVARFRRSVDGPAWDEAGIRAAVDQCGQPPCEIAAAAFALASDPAQRTPGMLTRPGWWWPRSAANASSAPSTYTMRCHEHPTHPASGCPECAAHKRPASPEAIAKAREEIRAARVTPAAPSAGPTRIQENR